MASCFIATLPRLFMLSLMLIGHVTKTTSHPLVNILYTLVTIQFLGVPRSNVQLHTPLLKLNITYYCRTSMDLFTSHLPRCCFSSTTCDLLRQCWCHQLMLQSCFSLTHEQVYLGWLMFPLLINSLMHSQNHFHINNFNFSRPRLDSHLGRPSYEGMIKILEMSRDLIQEIKGILLSVNL